MVNYICQELGNQQGWYWNTQSLATALRALSKYAVKNFGSGGPAFAYRIGGNGYKNGDGSKPIATVNFTESAWNNNRIAVKNNSSAKLYARLIVSGQAVTGEETGQANNIAVSVRYTDTKGNTVDVARLQQGADFVADWPWPRCSPRAGKCSIPACPVSARAAAARPIIRMCATTGYTPTSTCRIRLITRTTKRWKPPVPTGVN
jgi:hypothetical protein